MIDVGATREAMQRRNGLWIRRVSRRSSAVSLSWCGLPVERRRPPLQRFLWLISLMQVYSWMRLMKCDW